MRRSWPHRAERVVPCRRSPPADLVGRSVVVARPGHDGPRSTVCGCVPNEAPQSPPQPGGAERVGPGAYRPAANPGAPATGRSTTRRSRASTPSSSTSSVSATPRTAGYLCGGVQPASDPDAAPAGRPIAGCCACPPGTSVETDRRAAAQGHRQRPLHEYQASCGLAAGPRFVTQYLAAGTASRRRRAAVGVARRCASVVAACSRLDRPHIAHQRLVGQLPAERLPSTWWTGTDTMHQPGDETLLEGRRDRP
ncbi:hypothetical protein SGLAM104S_04747 [Streptomyces glaucescens]